MELADEEPFFWLYQQMCLTRKISAEAQASLCLVFTFATIFSSAFAPELAWSWQLKSTAFGPMREQDSSCSYQYVESKVLIDNRYAKQSIRYPRSTFAEVAQQSKIQRPFNKSFDYYGTIMNYCEITCSSFSQCTDH